ncbi:hypothetical protein D3C80_1405360 [compost metagenome]
MALGDRRDAGLQQQAPAAGSQGPEQPATAVAAVRLDRVGKFGDQDEIRGADASGGAQTALALNHVHARTAFDQGKAARLADQITQQLGRRAHAQLIEQSPLRVGDRHRAQVLRATRRLVDDRRGRIIAAATEDLRFGRRRQHDSQGGDSGQAACKMRHNSGL